MAQNCSPNSHVAHGTQHGWVLFGLEVDPDVEKGRRTRRRDAMEWKVEIEVERDIYNRIPQGERTCLSQFVFLHKTS